MWSPLLSAELEKCATLLVIDGSEYQFKVFVYVKQELHKLSYIPSPNAQLLK